MQYLYSALILHKTEQKITEAAIKKILKAAGVETDNARVKTLVAALSEVDIEEALATAMMAAPAAAPSSGSAPAKSGDAKEEKEEEEEEEEGEEMDDEDDGLGSLFG